MTMHNALHPKDNTDRLHVKIETEQQGWFVQKSVEIKRKKERDIKQNSERLIITLIDNENRTKQKKRKNKV